MTDSTATWVAIALGIGVFLVIVAVGWRNVQNRRIVRMQGANGQETIIVAGEDDEVTNIAMTTTTEAAPTEPEPAPEFDRGAVRDETTGEAGTDVPRTTTL